MNCALFLLTVEGGYCFRGIKWLSHFQDPPLKGPSNSYSYSSRKGSKSDIMWGDNVLGG